MTSEFEVCRRAASRFGLTNPSFDEVLQEVVPDEKYMSCAYSRALWHRLKDEAMEMVVLPACPVCDTGKVQPGRKTCSATCSGIARSPSTRKPKRNLSQETLDEIRRLYVGGMNRHQIAQLLGLSFAKVNRVTARIRVVTPEEEAALVERYQKGLSIRDTAQAIGLSRSTAAAILDKHGVVRRSTTAFAQDRHEFG